MIHQPHDALFRYTFTRKEHAIAELRAILPPEIVRNIDWDSLRVEEGHYVDEDLTKSESDILYTVNLLGYPIAIYLLFEHQSAAELLMGYRFLRHMVRIWEKWLPDHPNSRTIPLVLPILITHAEGGWKASTSMQELFDIPDELRPMLTEYLPSFRYIVDDLAGLTDEQMRGRAIRSMGLVTLALLRWARSGNEMIGHLLLYLDAFRELWQAPDGREAMRVALRYIYVATEPSSIHDLKEKFLDHLEPDAETEAMNIIEYYESKGRDDGERKGRKEGALEGKRSAFALVITARGLELPSAVAEKVNTCTDPALLDQWIARAAIASTAAEAIGEL